MLNRFQDMVTRHARSVRVVILRTDMHVVMKKAFQGFVASKGKENSEITWLVYELNRNASGVGYSMSDPDVIFTLWDDVLTALREGEAPQQSEVLAEISTRLPQLKSFDT